MYWFIAAIAIASAVMLFAPATPKLNADVGAQRSCANPALLLLSLLITLWLLITQITPDKLLPASLTLGVLASSATLTIPMLRRFMRPALALTAVLLLLNLLQMFS